MAYAELAALRPRAGGEYVYLHAGFGRVAAFLTGWTSFVAGFSGAIAASSCVLAFYLGRFLPVPAATRRSSRAARPVTLTLSPQTITALVAVWLMSWIHLRGVGPGRLVGNVLASLKIVALLLFIVARLRLRHRVAEQPLHGRRLAVGRLVAVRAGAGAVHLRGLERRVLRRRGDPRPGRNVPRALALGTLRGDLIYLLLNTLYLYVLPVGELAAVRGSVLDVIADRLLGSRAGDIMGVVSIVSLLASISAMVFAGPRVYYAMARDGMFFPAAARVHPRYRTPATSIVAQGMWRAARAAGQRQRPHHLHRVLDHRSSTAWRSRRCSSCASASRTPRGPIPPGAIRCTRHFRGGQRAHRRQRAVDRPGGAAHRRPADGPVGGRPAHHRPRPAAVLGGSARRRRRARKVDRRTGWWRWLVPRNSTVVRRPSGVYSACSRVRTTARIPHPSPVSPRARCWSRNLLLVIGAISAACGGTAPRSPTQPTAQASESPCDRGRHRSATPGRRRRPPASAWRPSR